MTETITLNKAAILESMGDDEELFIDMARLYIEESTTYCQNLQNTLDTSNPEALRQEAHTLKSLLATFSDEDGRQLAINVEQQAKNGQIDSEKTQQLIARVQLLAEVLQQELD